MNALARRAVWLLISLAALVAVGLGLRGLSTLMSGEDLALVRDLAGDRTPGWTACAHAISWLGRSSVLVPGAIVLALAAGALRRQLRGLSVVVGVLGAVIIQNVDKAIVERPRPPVRELEHVSGTSFPSGHATEATAFVVVLAVAVLSGARSGPFRWGVVSAAAAIAGGVALSRVYLGVHYPTDVVAGMLLGGAWGAIAGVVLASGQGKR